LQDVRSEWKTISNKSKTFQARGQKRFISLHNAKPRNENESRKNEKFLFKIIFQHGKNQSIPNDFPSSRKYP
jgi:hypothetical protein